MSRPVSLVLFLLLTLAAIPIGSWLRTAYAPEWMPTATPQGMRTWAVEDDCYSQLARVQRILNGQGLVQNHFTVENWPEGLTPSTTAPFDYVILALWAPLALFTRYPLDWAGTLVSPAMALVLVAFWMFFRSRVFQLTTRTALVVGFALIPSLVWATSFGRPRHQSLIVALLGIALTAEYERWEPGAARGWHIAAGIVWGFLCWTSLYEPLFVVVALIAFNFAVRRRESPRFGISFGIVMLIALLIEGVHVYVPPAEVRPVLARWLQFIAEMRGMNFGTFVSAISFSGWEVGSFITMLALPFGVYWLWVKGSATDRFVIGLTTALAGFALFEQRWLPYALLTELFCLARVLQLTPLPWLRALIAALLVFDLALANREQVTNATRIPPNQPSPELAQVAHSIDGPGGIMAPWWLSPALLYFSGQPIVSGSSHCGITGIEASAAFYASTSWDDATRILKERKVRWVVVWDEPAYVYPLLGSSQEILGLPVSTDRDQGDANATVAQKLIKDRDYPEDLFRLRAVTPHFKLYEFVAPAAAALPSLIHSPVAVR